jgi:hypothetical protein
MTEKPNILFIFSDQQHWQALGFEDPSFQTPNLDQRASERFETPVCRRAILFEAEMGKPHSDDQNRAVQVQSLS